MRINNPNDQIYYVYAWYFIDTDEIFHIGKGKGNRCYDTKVHRNQYFINTIKKYPDRIAVKFLLTGLTNDEALSKEREKERKARYEEEMARIKAMRAEQTRKLNLGQMTTKKSFEQAVWREYATQLDTAVKGFSNEAKFIDDNVKKYKAIIEKWSKLKNMNKDKISIGKKIVAALEEKSKNLKEIANIFKQGEGVWWNVSIPIEKNKTFEI